MVEGSESVYSVGSLIEANYEWDRLLEKVRHKGARRRRKEREREKGEIKAIHPKSRTFEMLFLWREWKKWGNKGGNIQA